MLHVAHVPATGAAADKPWPWRRVERDGEEPYSAMVEDTLRRLTFRVMKVSVPLGMLHH